MTRKAPRDAAAIAFVDDLFENPPDGAGELEFRLRSVDRNAARRELVQRLEHGEIQARNLGLFEIALNELGPGRLRNRFRAVALDRDRDMRERGLAQRIYCDGDLERMDAMGDALGPEDTVALMAEALVKALGDAGPSEAASLVAEIMHMWTPGPDGVLDDFGLREFGFLEHVRASVGTAPAIAYAEALADLDLQTYAPLIIEVLVSEPDAESVALLERLRDDASNPERRRLFQKATLRCRTQDVAPTFRRVSVPGHARISNCDGQGAFVVLAGFENPDGTITMADVVIRAAAEVRDGFVLSRITSEERDDFIRESQAKTSLAFTQISLPDAARLVFEAAQRGRTLKRRLSPDAREAMRLFNRLRGAEATLPVIEPASQVTPEMTTALFQRPIYEYWFFDSGDLRGSDPPHGRLNDPVAVEVWKRRAIVSLDAPMLRRRVAAMATYMSWWHHWNGEPDEAALCAALARETETDFANSHLVGEMLARTLAPGTEENPQDFGQLRGQLRQLFYPSVSQPTTRDLAGLDLSEWAWLILNNLENHNPGEHRLCEDARLELAHAIAIATVEWILTPGAPNPKRMRPKWVEKIVTGTGMTTRRAGEMVDACCEALQGAQRGLCGRCNVSCLARPNQDLNRFFFSEVHPAALGFAEVDDEGPGDPPPVTPAPRSDTGARRGRRASTPKKARKKPKKKR